MAKGPPPPIEIKPAQGGKLMAGLSSNAAGIENYIVKRDWRRYLDREIRSEGHEGLWLNVSLPSGYQITPPGSSSTLTVIAEARRGDDKKTIIAGNPTTLWAYTALDSTLYAVDPATGTDDYFANDTGIYTDETQYGWIQIATGLTAVAQRWEAVAVGDYIILNNGVDLPITYRPGDSQAFPIYELREQQIAAVKTIASHDGNLLVMGLWQINDPDFLALMAPTAGAVSASMNSSGVVSVGAATLFPRATVSVGLTLFWATGQAATIISVTGGTITTDGVQAIPLGTVSLENPAAYASFTDQSKMQLLPWRVLPSMPGQPRRFGSIVPVQASLGATQLNFQYPVRSLPELVAYNNQSGGTTSTIGGTTDITVLYAGLAGASLITSVIGIRNGIAMSCLIYDQVAWPIQFSNTSGNVSSLEATDAADSYAGTYTDLVGDGSAIIKALQLQSYIVVYKETASVYLGTFTGDSTTPYAFQEIKVANEGQCLRYRNTVVASGGGFYGSCHVYAGRNAFYKFDLFTQTPQEIPELQPAQQIFFNAAVADPENAFVAENSLTREWFWSWNNSGADRALCYDYAQKTVRTTSMDITASAKIQHPLNYATQEDDKEWLFLFGNNAGQVQRYGMWDAPAVPCGTITVTLASNGLATASGAFFTTQMVGQTILLATGDLVAITGYNSPTVVSYLGTAPNTAGANSFTILPATWHRNGQPYTSTLETGLGDLGSASSEKLVNQFIPIPSSKIFDQDAAAIPNAPLGLVFKSATNPGKAVYGISATMTLPHNLVQPTFIGYYVGVQINISGINMPFELAQHIWNVVPMASKSAGRL